MFHNRISWNCPHVSIELDEFVKKNASSNSKKNKRNENGNNKTEKMNKYKVHLCVTSTKRKYTWSAMVHHWMTIKNCFCRLFTILLVLLLLLLLFLLRLLSYSLSLSLCLCIYGFQFYAVCVRFCCVLFSLTYVLIRNQLSAPVYILFEYVLCTMCTDMYQGTPQYNFTLSHSKCATIFASLIDLRCSNDFKFYFVQK